MLPGGGAGTGDSGDHLGSFLHRSVIAYVYPSTPGRLAAIPGLVPADADRLTEPVAGEDNLQLQRLILVRDSRDLPAHLVRQLHRQRAQSAPGHALRGRQPLAGLIQPFSVIRRAVRD